MKTAATAAFWQTYLAHLGAVADGEDVSTFGDDAAINAALLALVRVGIERAIAALVRDFERIGERLPRVGGHAVAVDSRGTPVLIWCTTEVRVGPLVSGDAAFAWDEGEDDRSLASWFDGHRRYFGRQGEREGFVFDETTTPVVFERFRVVWPEALADR